MKQLKKQLLKEMIKNRIFLILMLILAAFTSFMYFFVHFSIDGNMVWLDALPALNEKQALYKNGLKSNIVLARYIFMAFTGLTGFVFAMFYYRFFREERRQIGCLKALGFGDRDLSLLFQKVSAGISLMGAVTGFICGYFVSDVLIISNTRSYLITGIVKEISPVTFIIGIFVPGCVFCVITLFMYGMIRGKETGILLEGTLYKSDNTMTFCLADRVSGLFPVNSRLSVRLALRNPIAVLLIVSSVMVVSVMFILAYSLNISSEKVFETQTQGHNYLYETYYDEPQTEIHDTTWNITQNATQSTDFYLTAAGRLESKKVSVDWTVAGGNENGDVFELWEENGNKVVFPAEGEIVISSQLEELYGLKKGDEIEVSVGKEKHNMTVSGIAFNAKQGWVYVEKAELAKMLSLPENAYTEIFSREDRFSGGTVITKEEKLDTLQRGMVSNRVSAVINQVIGCVIGCILLLLALLLNFQSSIRDILILQMLGYEKRDIHRMLMDIYKPLLLVSFLLTLLPGVWVTKRILKSLSIQIGAFL